MIDPHFLVLDKIGLFCSVGNFYIDPQQAVPLSIVSHAHADHAIAGSTNVYATPATFALMRARYGKKTASTAHEIVFQSPFIVNGVKITFYPAGHILGSAQVLLEYNNIRYLYTGDFKLQADSTCEPYHYVNADVLITETTFANPQTQHPDVLAEIVKLNADKHNILLGAYAIGKAQRMTALINTYCPQKQVVVHYSIAPFHRIYEQHNVPLQWQFYGRKLMKNNEDVVYIVPPITYRSYLKAINVKRIFVTGWNKPQHNTDTLLLISDHADWNDLLTVIEQAKPTEIWTLHGDGEHVASYFADKNIRVKALN